MPRQKYHRDRVYQEIGEPGPGAIGVGYVRFSMDLQSESSITTQKRLIKEYFDMKGWKLAGWREEPERSANNYLDDLIEERPVFAQVLDDAEAKRFQVVVCAFSNRWARSMEVGYASLTRLRRARVWWCTADGLWDIDKVQQDGFKVAFAVDMSMNEAYVRQLSKRTIAGKEDRAREGYHNGNVSFGYLDPEYPKAPDGAPSTWRPPRMPASPDPETFPALVRIGELVAEGWTDRAIANELEWGGYLSKTARFGERLLTKDTIAAIRRNWFPREFEAGCGYGTIETPQGELVVGKHQAAWPFDLWKRMIEVKRGQYHRPMKEARRRPHEFSRIIVCAACLRQLRVGVGGNSLPYYRDTSHERKLPCPGQGNLTVRSSLVVMQFGEVLRSVELPTSWREVIAKRCSTMASQEDDENERVRKRRAELDAEQRRLAALFRKGYISEQDLDAQMEEIRAEQFLLPVPEIRDAHRQTQEALSAGDTLAVMADYWGEALPDERRDMVWSLLNLEGLIYDLERHVIVGLKPRAAVLPVLALGLEATKMWEQRDGVLWLREEFWPPKCERERPGRSPNLSPSEQERAIMLIRQGMPLRRVAELFNTSYESVRRLAKSRAVELQRSERKLTPEQLEQAYALLRADTPFREVARRFGINPESLRRLAQRDGILVRGRGEKLTPTQRKLTQEQQAEARALIQSGVSLRQTARRLGISRSALEGILKEDTVGRA
jgi:DNA invertase Pin-like site-specific DNA recombinase